MALNFKPSASSASRVPEGIEVKRLKFSKEILFQKQLLKVTDKKAAVMLNNLLKKKKSGEQIELILC